MKYLSTILLIPLALGGTVANGQKQSLTAAEIINQHLSAVGGKDVLMKLKSRVALGTVRKENEAEGELAIFSELPNHVSANYRFEKYDWKLHYDGTKAIILPPVSRKLYVITEKYQQMLASGLMFNSITLSNFLTETEATGVKLEAKGTKKLHGRAAYVVEVKRTKGEAMRLYFDTESFMWVRTDYGTATLSKQLAGFTNDVTSRADDETEIDFYIETSDFRVVDGVKLPFQFVQVVTYPILQQKLVGTITGTIKSYAHNLPIDPQSFQ